MSNVIKFPAMIKQQVLPTAQLAQEYAEKFMACDVYATANVVELDGLYVVTVFPHHDLMAEAVLNARKEWLR